MSYKSLTRDATFADQLPNSRMLVYPGNISAKLNMM